VLKTAVYKLGRARFTVESTNAELLQELPNLFFADNAGVDPIHTISARSLRELLMEVVRLHDAYIWLSAACIISPEGHKVLISGQSSAGKSTTTLALAMKYGWKAASEDLTCLDIERNQMVAFPTPFSLKKGTRELLQETIGTTTERLAFGEYLPLSNIHADGEFDTNFDLTLYFDKVKKDEPILYFPCTPGEYVRLLLPSSNLVKNSGSIDKLAEYVASCPCYKITGGSLSERMDLVLQLTSAKAPRSAACI